MRKATYAAISTAAAREMRLPSRLARACRSAWHSGHSAPQLSPRILRPHFAHATSGSPLCDSISKLLGRGSAPEIVGANLVADDRGDDRIPDPLGAVELANMIQHHRGGEHLGGRIGDALSGDVGGA